MRLHQRLSHNERRPGFVLLTVLIVVVLLTLAAYQFAELMTSEYRATYRTTMTAKARNYAESGIQYALALLGDPETFQSTLGGNPFDNPAAFRGILVEDNENSRLRGRFSLIAPTNPEDGYSDAQPFRYGLTDECAKINLNSLLKADSSGEVGKTMLMKLPNMTEDAANSILDWIDTDEDLRTNGAESQSYAGRSPAYRCKNGPLDSLEEMLYIRNVTPRLLFGNDLNRNGRLDPSEGEGAIDRGIAPYLTIYSRELNKSSEGAERVFINRGNLRNLKTELEPVLGPELTNYLILYRAYGAASSSSSSRPSKQGSTSDMEKAASTAMGSRSIRPKSLSSVVELVNSTVRVPSSDRNQPDTIFASPLTGNSAIREMLPLLFEGTTTQRDSELPARVNINTASSTVLSTLPGVGETELQSILERRPSTAGGAAIDPIYSTPTWLITEANLQPTIVRGMERYITCRTQVYRVQAIGYFDEGGPSVRIEAVVDANQGAPRILYYRDLSELGKGIDVRNY